MSYRTRPLVTVMLYAAALACWGLLIGALTLAVWLLLTVMPWLSW